MARALQQDPLNYLEIMRRRRWAFIIPAVAITALSIPVVLSLSPTYKSTTLIMVEAQKVPQEFVRTTVTTPIEDRLKTISQQILSRTRLERVIEEFKLYRQDEKAPEAAGWLSRWWAGVGAPKAETKRGSRVSLDVVERMQKNIEISVKGGNTFSVSYIGDAPETVMNVTNKLASLFIEENLKVREEQAEGTAEFLDSELNSVKTRLEAQEDELKRFKERHMGELPGQLDTNLRTLDRLQFERQRLQDSLKAAEDRYLLLSQQIASTLPAGERTAPTLLVHLQGLRSRLAALRMEFKDEYPDVLLVKKEIAAVEAELKRSPKAKASPAPALGPDASLTSFQLADQERDIKAIKQRQQEVAAQIRQIEQRVERTPLREQQLTQVLRDYENARKSYQTLLDKRQDARIAESLERRQKGEMFRILDPANYPEKPFKPNRTRLLLLGLVVGIGAGVGSALLREQLDPSIQGEDELIQATAGIPLLAAIPLSTPEAPKRMGRRPALAAITGGRDVR